MKRIAVIGGGITGLTAAYRLRKLGHEVVLLEVSDRTGGVIQSVSKEGYLAECGPNTIMETSPVIGELISDLGLEKRKLISNPEADKKFIIKGGKPVEVPGSPPAFFASPFFSWKAKLRLMREPFVGRGSSEDESLADFVRRRLGQEFLDYAINPMVGGIYAGNPEKLSVREAFPKVYALEEKYGSLIKGQIQGAKERKKTGAVSRQNAPKLSFDEGVQVLPDALSRHLGDIVKLRTKVERIRLSEGKWYVSSEVKSFDGIILALPAFRLADLEFEGAGQIDLQPLKSIIYPPVASVVLGFRRGDVAHPLDGFGALVPEVENRHTLGTIFSSSLFEGRAPKDHVLLTSYVGGMRQPALAVAGHDRLCELTLEDLRSLYGISGEPTFRHSRLYRQAIPQYHVGYGKHRELMARTEKVTPGLRIAGHCRDGISLGDSIDSGDQAARKMDEYLAAS